ncbi:uncharacterized protein LOC129611044 [Condylostylus longicornis]|uniref:uncharacterized protein LOC129611044 n=1 Tax=Condylostylus longicornis TaxID=2530218 RepID=UPI00244DDB30|nr:uncharacterized protein LOC129611044 [Condylostylus longicornis]
MDIIWLNSCLQLNINDQIAKKWFHKIENKLSTESHRFFHTWNELIIKKEQYLLDVKPIIILAVFFQYYEFNVEHNLTEKNCAAFLEFCEEANFSDEVVINRVRKLLGDDSVEEYTGYSEDINLIQDLNLLILSSSYEEYETYCDLIRKEYATLNDSSYNGMRLKILETFLTIPAIYQTPEYFSKFENKARDNIKNEIERLKTNK